MERLRLKSKILVVIMACVLLIGTPSAQAKVIGFVGGADNGDMYEYEYKALLESYALFLMGAPAPLYEDYFKREIELLYDDVNSYVDYKAVLEAYAIALITGKKFDLDSYTSGPKAKIVTMDKVTVVTVVNGKLKFTEKIIIDPVAKALDEVNAAYDASSLRIALESMANILGLNLSGYNQLSDYGKTLSAAGILQRKENGYTEVTVLKAVFDEEVKKLLDNPVAVALHEANSLSDAVLFENILVSNANLFGLDLSVYNQLLISAKTMVIDSILQRRGTGFADATVLKTVFDEEVQVVLTSVLQILENVNTADGLDKLEQLLLENGKVLGLELDAFALIISSRKNLVLSQVFEFGPYETADLLKQTFNDAVADMLKSYVIVAYSDYNLTVAEMVDKQMSLKAKPQWQVNGRWEDAPTEEVQYYVDPVNFVLQGLIDQVTEVIVGYDNLRVRDIPTTEGIRVDTVHKGQIFTVEEVQEVLDGTAAGTEGYWFKITVGDVTGWVCGLYTDWVVVEYSNLMLQFLNLTGPSGVTVGDLRLILNGKGILSEKEEVFYQASRANNINEIFLTSLALHESGNGTSTLANGQLYEGQMVYNMFGIGAVDSNPNYYGAKYAYEQGWFSPEEAIIGGARFASNNYVNHSSYRQDTLYKMRWNPGDPGKHQYATDVAWARKQTRFIRDLYKIVNIYNLRFDIPRYKLDIEQE